MKSGQPNKFKVNICFDQEEYPEGLHIHPEVVKAAKFHLVPMLNICGKNIEPDMRYFLATFTWNEFGISSVIGEGSSLKWRIGQALVRPFDSCKWVAFINL